MSKCTISSIRWGAGFSCALLSLSLFSHSILAAGTENVRGSFLVDSKPVGQTPKHLGVCLEVTENADRSNLWDWLADSGASMARIIHPDKDLRLIPASEAMYKGIETRKDFDAFREKILADPEQNLPWQNYAFDKPISWLGVADQTVKKTGDSGLTPMISMAYATQYYPKPLLKKFTDDYQPPDENIDWGAATSAYEYYFAMIYRYAIRDGATHYMMLNEPGEDLKSIKQIGVLARIARQAMEDVRSKLTDKRIAANLRLSGPACHFPWEEYWPYVGPYVDFTDYHFYDPDPDMFKRHYDRMAMRTRQSGKKLAFTEFNRIGGPLQPDQATFCLKPSLQLGGLIMSVLAAGRTGDPGCELALLYEFQAPATHRSFKSLVYGDMNLIDWTGQDKALNSAATEWHPSFEELQLRFATPAYHVFKMLARCVPGAAGSVESYEVLDLGESSKSLGHVFDSNNRQNVFRMLNENKYYSLGGVGPDFRLLAVRAPDRLIIMILNPGPTAAKRVGFDLDLLQEKYATAVVRETSLWHRDEVVDQIAITDKRVLVDIPSESMTQIILVKDDLAKIEELKLDEVTNTPGTIENLGLHQTTRLSAKGRIGDRWLDVGNLNVVWGSSDQGLVTVYQGGLVQRVRQTGKQVAITAKVFNNTAKASLVVQPDSQGRKLAPKTSMITNGQFEIAPDKAETASGMARAYREPNCWQMGASIAPAWVQIGGQPLWSLSSEQNHTPGGAKCLKLQIKEKSAAIPALNVVSDMRDGFELATRKVKVSYWIYRPSEGGASGGTMAMGLKFNNQSKQQKPTLVANRNIADLPAGQWVEVEQIFTAPDDASRVQVQLLLDGESIGSGTVYVDDVAIVGVN